SGCGTTAIVPQPTVMRDPAPSDLHDVGHDHRAAAVGVVDPPADRAAHDLLQLVRVTDALQRGPVERLGDQRNHRVEHRRVLGEALCRHGRAADHLAGHRVDHHRRGDEATVAEDAPLGQQRLTHVADGQTVDIDVSALHVTDEPGPAVDQVDHVAVLAQHDPVRGHPGLDRQPGVRTQVPPFSVYGDEVAGAHHVEQVEQLA